MGTDAVDAEGKDIAVDVDDTMEEAMGHRATWSCSDTRTAWACFGTETIRADTKGAGKESCTEEGARRDEELDDDEGGGRDGGEGETV